MQPDWAEHSVTLVIIAFVFISALVSIIGVLIRYIFKSGENRLMRKMEEICEAIKGKADVKEVKQIEEQQKVLFRRVNTHGHDIDCSAAGCKPETKAVLLHDEG